MLEHIAVFCGSAKNSPEKYCRAADQVGRVLARQGRKLVYGSGDWGLMGLAAKGAQAEGGYVIGINVRQFQDEPSTVTCDEYWVEENMQMRKLAMIDRADAFLALPGGMGTLDELTEIYTQAQIGAFDKPLGLLNVDHFYDGFIAQLDRAHQDGFINDLDRARLLVAEEIEPLLALLDRYAEQKK